MKIIGAGLSGLMAGCLIPGSTIYEKQSSLPNNHGAILRFRNNKISKALNIPFKEVTVYKDIYIDGQLYPFPTISMLNQYSFKVTGKYSQRSIGNCETVTRYIAPDDFIPQLAERCNIEYDCDVFGSFAPIDFEEPMISTIPMPVIIENLSNIPGELYANFQREPIWTRTMTVPGVDLYQTIYFPALDPHNSVYRASFTGDKLIVECINNNGVNLDNILPAFGMPVDIEVYTKSVGEQEYGKIIDIDPHTRRAIMSELTHRYNIYSLGRYATWRNILLDDVFEDIYRIMDLVKLDSYSRRIKIAEEQ